MIHIGALPSFFRDERISNWMILFVCVCGSGVGNGPFNFILFIFFHYIEKLRGTFFGAVSKKKKTGRKRARFYI